MRGLGCRRFFEIGTNRGRTTWTVARHNPELRLYTLDVPPSEQPDETAFELGADDRMYFRPPELCGDAFRGTPEAARITQLWGDSATFDFSPYHGEIDFVYGDDYATGPGVYEALLELAPMLDHPVYHLLETRMAIFSRQNFVVPAAPDRFPFGLGGGALPRRVRAEPDDSRAAQ